jgi:phage gpG-like protein
MSVAFRLEGTEQIRRIERALSNAAQADIPELLDAIGAHVVDQTQVRISETKRAPRGYKWRKWSPAYAATRHSGHSLLRGEGHLLDSIQHVVEGNDRVSIGSNLKYARNHQVGTTVPMREYLGLSHKDAKDVVAEVEDWLKKLIP